MPFQALTPIASSSLVSVDVAKLFRGIETLFPIVIDSLYNGIQVVSPQEVTNSLLSSVYLRLELQLPFTTPQIEHKPPTTVIVSRNNEDNNEASMNMSICPQCNMLFVSKDEFLAHSKVKCARKLTCYTCGKLFHRVQGLALHLVDVRHGETVCSICAYEGEAQKDAEIHIGKLHSRKNFVIDKIVIVLP